ncbi:MAG: DinB family protein [Pirellulales bacterium]
MHLKLHAQYALQRARGLLEQLLESFKTDDDWFFQVHPQANHATWIVGHLGLADNMFITCFRENLATKPDGWDDLFWFGSQLKENHSVYPPRAELLAYLRDRRERLIDMIVGLTDEELAAPAPDEMSPIAGAPCVGHLLLFAALHENTHIGQLTVAHRGLGNRPLFSPG